MYADPTGPYPDAPPTLEEVGAEFGGSIFLLIDQPHVERAGVGVFRSDGRIQEVSIHYSYLVNPEDRSDPKNFEGGAVDSSLPLAEGMPKWLSEWVDQLRFPLLSDVVKTIDTYKSDSDLDEVLSDHLDYLRDNNPSHLESVPGPPRTIPYPSSAVTVEIDGIETAGISMSAHGLRGVASAAAGRTLVAGIESSRHGIKLAFKQS